MTQTVTFPKLFSTNSHGTECSWSIWTVDNVIHTKFGQTHGKMQHITKEVHSGKNLNKKNATTPSEQAANEAQSMWNKKKDTGKYITEDEKGNEEGDTLPQWIQETPMLATTYGDASPPKYPDVWVQPKFDGVRLKIVFDDQGESSLYTRQNKPIIHLTHLNEYFNEMRNDPRFARLLKFPCFFDGEIFSDALPFEELSGLCRKTKPLKNSALQMNIENKKKLLKVHVFDVCVQSVHTFGERLCILNKINKELSDNDPIKIVDTVKCIDDETMHKMHRMYVDNGHEGIIIRNDCGLYKGNQYRSPHLQKLKFKKDAEYEIIGFKEGTGKLKNTVIWRCVTDKGSEFDVTPCGTIAFRTELYTNAKTHVGKLLTVEFQEMTSYGVPRFPIGKALRDYE